MNRELEYALMNLAVTYRSLMIRLGVQRLKAHHARLSDITNYGKEPK